MSSLRRVYSASSADLIAAGKIPFRLIGMTALPTGNDIVLWPKNATYVFPSTPMQMELVSSSANDAAAGTGARTVEVTYLDANYDEKTEIITLDGTTPVATVATNILRVQKIKVLTAGTSKYNEGIVNITHVSAGTVYDSTTAKISLSTSAKYTVPRSKTLYINSVDYSSNTLSALNTISFTLEATEGATDILLPINASIQSLSHTQVVFSPPVKIVEKSDIVIKGRANATTKLNGSAFGWIE